MELAWTLLIFTFVLLGLSEPSDGKFEEIDLCVRGSHYGLRMNNSCFMVVQVDKRSEAKSYCGILGGQMDQSIFHTYQKATKTSPVLSTKVRREFPKLFQLLTLALKTEQCTDNMTNEESCVTSCDVKACPLKKYGQPPHCQSVCYCQNPRRCDIRTGACLDGKCLRGRFRPPECREKCKCLGDTVCDRISGACVLGCKEGWRGESCQNKLCPAGHAVPPDCYFKCHCVDDDDCDVMTGACANGCAKGWEGSLCSVKSCVLGSSACQQEVCPCSDPKCKASVKCLRQNGCPLGWTGPSCGKRVCPFGLFDPPECNRTCHCQVKRFCSPLDGDCEGQKCEPLWTGYNCLTPACPHSRFGPPECNQYCFCNSFTCHPNGTCPFGCAPGWTGKTCNESRCPLGFYNAPECNLECQCRKQYLCNSKTGVCEQGGCIDYPDETERFCSQVNRLPSQLTDDPVQLGPVIGLPVLLVGVLGGVGVAFLVRSRGPCKGVPVAHYQEDSWRESQTHNVQEASPEEPPQTTGATAAPQDNLEWLSLRKPFRLSTYSSTPVDL